MLTMNNLTKRHCLWMAKEEDKKADEHRVRVQNGHRHHEVHLGSHSGRAALWRELAETVGMPVDATTAASRVEYFSDLSAIEQDAIRHSDLTNEAIQEAKIFLEFKIPVVMAKLDGTENWRFIAAIGSRGEACKYATQVAEHQNGFRVMVILPNA